MLRPRIEVVSLRYGCHAAEWTLPELVRPVVIAGPNGSGKSTLVDGLVRTLFGFDRRRGEDAAELDARRPWGRDGMQGRVVMLRHDERIEIHRNFLTDRVRVHAPDEEVEHFVGDGNPAARNQEARHYRQILTDLVGLRDLGAYQQTLLIQQGELPRTALGDHLLRVAAGGHARVESARRQIAQSHRATTRRPIHPAAAAAINPRELEKLDEEIDSVRARLREARVAGERRTPLALDRERVADRLAALDEEVVLLENALSALARTDATELTTRHLRHGAHRIEEAAAELEAAAAEVDEARRRHEEAVSGGLYPDDFPQRLARAEVHWEDLEELGRPAAPALGLGALAALALAGGLLAAGYPYWAAVAGGVGLLAAAAWGTLWLWSRRRRSAAREAVHQLLESVPGAEAMGAGTSRNLLARFTEQQRAQSRLTESRQALAEAIREGRAVLKDSAIETADPDPVDDDSGSDTGARRLLARLEKTAEEARERLAVGRIELDRIGDLSLALPDDVAPTEEAVAMALQERRAERSRVQESLRDVSQELLERGTPSESVEALEGLLASLEPRRDALARKAEVLEAAHALIADAYDVFRDHDQDRLAQRVSDHVARLASGRLEGIQVEGSLDEARVRTEGRLVPMTTPPLSFGEFHTLQLGVRLGAAEFLAGMGILPPLIIDEPFAHLDVDRAKAVWRLLAEVATHRQVLITTQDTRLLDDLGVEPDVLLEA